MRSIVLCLVLCLSLALAMRDITDVKNAVKAAGKALMPPPFPVGAFKPSVMTQQQTLKAGSVLQSPTGQFTVQMMPTGNLVLFSGAIAIWSTQTEGYGTNGVLTLKQDGNLVLDSPPPHLPFSQPWWSTQFVGSGVGPFTLQVDDHGVLAVVDANGLYQWQTMPDGTMSLWNNNGWQKNFNPRTVGGVDPSKLPGLFNLWKIPAPLQAQLITAVSQVTPAGITYVNPSNPTVFDRTMVYGQTLANRTILALVNIVTTGVQTPQFGAVTNSSMCHWCWAGQTCCSAVSDGQPRAYTADEQKAIDLQMASQAYNDLLFGLQLWM